MKPDSVSDGSGNFSLAGSSMLKFCTKADTTRNNEFRANVSPAHRRFPAPNGSDLSSLGENIPDSSKNRSGLNSSGESQVFSSLWAPCNDENTIVPCSNRFWWNCWKWKDHFDVYEFIPLECRSPWKSYLQWLYAANRMERVFHDEVIHESLPRYTANWK